MRKSTKSRSIVKSHSHLHHTNAESKTNFNQKKKNLKTSRSRQTDEKFALIRFFFSVLISHEIIEKLTRQFQENINSAIYAIVSLINVSSRAESY